MGLAFLAALLLGVPHQVSHSPIPGGTTLQVDTPVVVQVPLLQQGGVIKEIRFVGLRRFSSETVRMHTTSRVGESLDQAIVERDVHVLAALGWFDSVAAEVAPITGPNDDDAQFELRLVFELKESPFLSQVQFQGSHLVSRERITQIFGAKKISLKRSAPLDRVELWRASRAIKSELEELGHPQAEVHIVLETVGPATVRARFEIEDGPGISVSHVTFAGNGVFSEGVLRRQMRRIAPTAHLAALRDKNICTQERLQEDLSRVAEYYRNHGYPEARIGAPMVEIRQDVGRRHFAWPRRRTVPSIQISVPVSEGTFYKLGAVEVHSDSPTPALSERSAALITTSGLRPGEPYSAQKLERVRDALTHLPLSSTAQGPPLTSGVSENLQFDPTNGTAVATFSISQSTPYTLRRLDFSGERRFSDRYYRRHFPLREGDAFDPRKLEVGLRRLARTGYLRPMKPDDIRVQFDEAHHTVDASIHVTEIGQQKISLIGGRSDLGNTIGIAYSVFNLLGGEELISSEIEGSPDSLHLALTLAEESLFGSRASLSFTVFQNVLRPRLPGVLGNQHFLSSRSSGLGVGFGYPVAKDQALTAAYALSRQSTQYALPFPPTLTGLAKNEIGSSTSSHSFGLNWSGDNAHQHWDTSAAVSGGWLGGNENLLRSSAEYTRSKRDPLTNGRNTWAFRSYAAGVSSFDGSLLFQDRYFAGNELLRGFRGGEIAPYAVEDLTDASGKASFHAIPAGADLLAAVNTEYRVPLAPRTEAVGFFDTGSGWLLPNWLGPRRPLLMAGTNGLLRASTGFELRWQAPIVEQPLRLDFAVNPLRLARSFLLTDGSHFRASDRQWAWGWGLGTFF